MRMMSQAAATMIVALLVAITMTGAAAQPATPVGVTVEADLSKAVTWLIGQQAEDGGFPGFEGGSDPSMTVDATLALVAAGLRGEDTAGAVLAASEYLASGDVAATYIEPGPGQAAKLVLATVAAGGDPRDVGGVDALAAVSEGQDAETGRYGVSVFDHALAIMALVATDSEVPASAVETLVATQSGEGGWVFDGTTYEGAADTNTTAMVVQALVALGETDSELVTTAMDYLEGAVEDDGAVYQPGSGLPADSSSTALVLQAAIATGDDLAAAPWSGLQPALAGLQNASGAFHYNADDTADNLFSTVQAIPAVAGIAFPIVPADSGATPVASPVAVLPSTESERAA